MKYLALLDCNNFFVSCERLFRPDLLGKPVVVLSSNDGCVVSRSQEVKDKGIPMGVPYFQIKDILKEINGIAFSSHFSLYRDISRRVFEVVKIKFPDLEQYSIDECFFAFDSEEPEQVALSLKREVERLVGVPVSIGVAFSKTQAKYQSGIAKRTNGVAVIDFEKWQTDIATIRLSEIWGVGPNRFRQFRERGIETVSDLLRLTERNVGQLFGLEGVRLQGELRGQKVISLLSSRPLQKSIMNSQSFSKETTNLSVLEAAVKYHVYQGVKDLEIMGLLASSLRVSISTSRFSDFAWQGSSKEAILEIPTANLFMIQKVALELLKACYKENIPYKKAGVVLTGLVKNKLQTPTLFSVNVDKKEVATKLISETIFAINKKYGKESLKLGLGDESKEVWQGKRQLMSPSYTTDWTEIKVVCS